MICNYQIKKFKNKLLLLNKPTYRINCYLNNQEYELINANFYRLIDVDNITFSQDTSTMDEKKYIFTSKLTMQLKSSNAEYIIRSIMNDDFTVVMFDDNDEMYVVNPTNSYSIDYTFNLYSTNDGDNGYTINMTSVDTHPMLHMTTSLDLTTKNNVLCEYQYNTIERISIGNFGTSIQVKDKGYANYSVTIQNVTDYEFVDCSLATSYADGYFTHTLQFTIPFSQDNLIQAYRLLEYDGRNEYSAIVYSTTNRYVIGVIEDGLHPRFTINSNESDENITINLTTITPTPLVAMDGTYDEEWRETEMTECVNGDLYAIERQYISYNGIDWDATSNLRRGRLIEEDSPSCGDDYRVRWVNNGDECVGGDLYWTQVKEESFDGGQTWQRTTITRRGDVKEYNSNQCISGSQTRWVKYSTQCVGKDLYWVEIKEISYDGGYTWERTEDTRVGDIKEANAMQCGGGDLSSSFATYSAVSGQPTVLANLTDNIFGFIVNDDGNIIKDNTYTPNSNDDLSVQIIWLNDEVISLANIFKNSDIKTLGEGFFDMFSKVQSFAYIFEGCKSLTSVSESLFASNTQAYDFVGTFKDSGIQSIGANLFTNQSGVIDSVRDIFNGSALQSVPNSLFASSYRLSSVDRAFANCPNLTTVGNRVFASCNRIASATDVFKNSPIASIGDETFYRCSALTSYTDSFTELVTLGDATFIDCVLLASVGTTFRSLPKIQTIGNQTFKGCKALTSADNMFYNFSTLTHIGEETFANCTSLSTANNAMSSNPSLTAVGHYSFKGCTALKRADYCFKGNRSMTDMGIGVFEGCSELLGVNNLCESCLKLDRVKSNVFSGCTKLTSLENSFKDCFALIYIDSTAFADCRAIGNISHIFDGCIRLTNTTVNGLFANANNITVADSAFANCKELTSIPSSVCNNKIRLRSVKSMFFNSGIQRVDEPPFAASTNLLVVANLFQNCTKLEHVTSSIFATNTKINDFRYTFSLCSAYTRDVPMDNGGLPIYKRAENEGYTAPTYYGACFKDCTNLAGYDAIPTDWKTASN